MRHILGMVLAVIAAAASAQQPYPSRLVKLITPQAAGSTVDAMLRAVGAEFSARVGQPFIVENRPGANTIVGLDACRKSPPDGYTLCNLTSSGYLNPFLYSKLPFDLQKDFVPITNLVMVPEMIAVHPSVPVSSWQELVAYSKANPGKLNYSGYGPGSTPEMVFEWLKKETGANFTQVPYKNVVEGMQGFFSGDSHVVLIGLSFLIPQIKAGKAKGLSIYAERRSALVPGVPTLAEAGVPDWKYRTWFGLGAPAGTPRDVIDRVAAEIGAIMSAPAFRERMFTLGFEPDAGTPDQYTRFLSEALVHAAELVKASGAKLD
jgi:tripartite-type tricarboxylate transporter receptor subunit TctC